MRWEHRFVSSRQHDDETGAEMIEFAFVVVMLVGLVYLLVVFGIFFGTQQSITQAASDASRAGMVYQSPTYAVPAAQNAALDDLSWLVGGVTCASSTVSCLSSSTATCPTTVILVCVNAYENVANTNITTTVTYNYQLHPVIPLGFGTTVVSPSVITSTSTYQVSAS